MWICLVCEHIGHVENFANFAGFGYLDTFLVSALIFSVYLETPGSWDRSWSRILPVVAGSPAGDDLNPDVAFSVDGRALIAWWSRDANNRGTVYFSMFLETTWMEPLKISTDGFGGRHPTIGVNRSIWLAAGVSAVAGLTVALLRPSAVESQPPESEGHTLLLLIIW